MNIDDLGGVWYTQHNAHRHTRCPFNGNYTANLTARKKCVRCGVRWVLGSLTLNHVPMCPWPIDLWLTPPRTDSPANGFMLPPSPPPPPVADVWIIIKVFFKVFWVHGMESIQCARKSEKYEIIGKCKWILIEEHVLHSVENGEDDNIVGLSLLSGAEREMSNVSKV